MSCPGDNYLVPGANPCEDGGGGGGTAGVTSLNDQTGVVTLVSTDGSITITDGAGQVNLEVTSATSGVTSLNAATGILTIVGAGATSVLTAGNVITVGSLADVTSINDQIGAIAIVGDVTGSALVNQYGTTTSIYVPNPTVTNISGSGIATVSNTGSIFNVAVPAPTVTNITGSGIANVTNTSGVFNVDVPNLTNGVTSLNTFIGAVTIASADSSVTVVNLSNNIDLSVPAPAVNNITGSGSAVVTSASGVFNVDVPAATVTNITGTGSAIVTNASGVFNVDVPAPPVIDITGSGVATVTSIGGVFNVDVPSSAGAVTSLNTFSGAVNITSLDSSVTIVNAGNDIDLSVPIPTEVVDSLNTLTGALNCISSDGSILITPSLTDIDFTVVGVAPPAGVTSLNTLINVVDIQGGTGITVNTDTVNNIITIENTKSPDVVTLNGLDGDLTISSLDASVLIDSAGTNIDLTVSLPTTYTTTTPLVPSLTTGVEDVLSIPFTINKDCKILIMGQLGLESASGSTARVISGFRIGVGPIPFTTVSQSIHNVSPATATNQLMTNTAIVDFVVGSYTLYLQAYAAGVPNGTVLIDTARLSLMTNLL